MAWVPPGPESRIMNDPRFRDRKPAPPLPENGERLQKVLADAGISSRRDAEFAIRAGRVRVNGRRVFELPCLVDPGRDLIEFDGAVDPDLGYFYGCLAVGRDVDDMITGDVLDGSAVIDTSGGSS